MYNWATDHARGNLLSDGFRNPFEKRAKLRREVSRDPFGEPDISTDMAVDFIQACDSYQLPLFAMIILYGLRAAEPRFLFREHLDQQWLKVVCIPEIDYLTKGQRDKRFPLVPSLKRLIVNPKEREGLIFTRRRDKCNTSSPMFGASLQECIDEFRRCCRGLGATTALQRQTAREQILSKAGALNYDQIEHEFKNIASSLQWPKSATMKDFRHLFSTSLENAGVPVFYRRYLMGQSPGNSPIVTYTHLNELDQQYGRALQSQLKPIIDAITQRSVELEL
jgi:integrase